VFRCTTDGEGLAQPVRRLQPLTPRLIVLEASGGYESIVAVSLAEAGLPVAIVNPRQSRKFAEALGQLAKTHPIDARVTAHFAEAVRPPRRAMPDDTMTQLQERLGRRRQLVVMINAEKQRAARAKSNVTQRSHNTQRSHRTQRSDKTMLKSLEAERGRIDRAIDKLIQQSPLWCKKLDLLTSVPGVGDIVARTLLAELFELGTIDRHQIAALAPFSRDSGRKKGKRFVRAGRVQVRALVYMAGLVAIRFNPPLKSFYRRLREAGKPPRLALVAVMRKLLTILDAMLRDHKPWAVPA
jgi:transposase